MAGLEGDISTPLGSVSKKTALIAGGLTAGVLGIAWYRSKTTKADALASASTSEIDPATGYPYGSPEDAAALAAQANYVSPGGAGGGGGGGITATGPGHFATNAEWSQYAVTYLVNNDAVQDSGPLTATLGKYLLGQYPGSNDAISLVEQAIAVAGLPPVPGTAGYPPSINTSGTPAPPPPDGGGGDVQGPVPGAPSGLHQTKRYPNAVEFAWTPVANATGYRIYGGDSSTNDLRDATGNTVIYLAGLSPHTTYGFSVRTVNEHGQGPASPVLMVSTA